MATKTLAQGSVTFASPAWSGAGIADTDDLEIIYDFGLVELGLDQSALTDGANSLYIRSTCRAGQIGSPSAGPLLIDIIDTFSNDAPVTAYIAAAGDDDLIANANVSNGVTYLMDGAVTNITQTGGTLNVNAETANTTFTASAGFSQIAFAAKATTSTFIATGGRHILRRLYDEIIVAGNAQVTIDIPDGTSMTGTALYTYGGRVSLVAGGFPTVVNYGGIFDTSDMRVATTLGSTSWNHIGTRFIDSPLLVTTNRSPFFGSTQVAGSPIPV